MQLMHKLEKLVDNGFQKFPVSAQKPRILPNDVHDVAAMHRSIHRVVRTRQSAKRRKQKIVKNIKERVNTYLAITALLSFPRLSSHIPKRSLMTVTKNFFSSSSLIAPEIEPIAQHSVFKLCQDHSEPSTARRRIINKRNGSNYTKKKRNFEELGNFNKYILFFRARDEKANQSNLAVPASQA